MRSNGRVAIAIALAAVALARDARAGGAETTASTPIRVELSSSVHLDMNRSIARLSVAASDVADVAAFPPDQILVTGKQIGSTTATIWYSRDEVEILSIEVTFPLSRIRASLRSAIPDAKTLDVQQAGRSLVITGHVRGAAQIEQVEELVLGFTAASDAGGKLINLVTVGGEHQVQMEVAFAEVSRSSLKQIGLNFWAKKTDWAGGLLAPTNGIDGVSPQLGSSTGVAGLNTSDPTAVPLLQQPLSSTFGAIFSSVIGDFPFSAALSLLSNRGYARVLAEPTLVAMSGETAEFLAGGEFPIPLPQGLGQVGVEFKKFGIQVEFLPTVVDDTIQLAVETTVSDIDFSLGLKLASVTVPGLTERHARTTIRLKDGQSFVIAGLLSDRVRSSIDKVPGLGDLPILGTMFRSSSYRREETELLVVVTAHVVRPLGERPELPGAGMTTDPSDLELFLLGRTESRRTESSRKPAGAIGFSR